MKTTLEREILERETLEHGCEEVRELIQEKELHRAEEAAVDIMNQYPHSAIPHNLLGIVLEQEQEHTLAMRHFRAAYVLEPYYKPSRYNLELLTEDREFFDDSSILQRLAFDENDCRASGEFYLFRRRL